MIGISHIKDALRFFKLRFAKRKKYEGNYENIARQIIDDCWNGTYFQVSSGNFAEFYVRDFAFCAESLCRLGYKEKVGKTLEYALKIFEKNNKITSTITDEEVPIDVFGIGPDSLALLIRTLRVTNNTKLIERHQGFINKEIMRYHNKIIDKQTGMVKNGYFTSVKDHSIRNSSSYDNAMMASLQKDCKELKLINPFNKDIQKLMKKKLWTGKYFKDDLDNDVISSDANIYPYYLDLFDNQMLKSSVKAIQKELLDKPFPIKYTITGDAEFLTPMKWLVPNYVGNTIWMHNGLNYLTILKRADRKRARMHLMKYRQLIEKQRNFVELYNPDGTIYKTPFYKADEGLLWCSIFLDLAKEFKI